MPPLQREISLWREISQIWLYVAQSVLPSHLAPVTVSPSPPVHHRQSLTSLLISPHSHPSHRWGNIWHFWHCPPLALHPYPFTHTPSPTHTQAAKYLKFWVFSQWQLRNYFFWVWLDCTGGFWTILLWRMAFTRTISRVTSSLSWWGEEAGEGRGEGGGGEWVRGWWVRR